MTVSGDQDVDDGPLRLSFLSRAFDDELTAGALLALANEDPWGLRRVSLTETERTWSAQLTAPPRRVTLSVPESPSPRKTPAGRRSSCPDPLIAPGGQPDPRNAEQSQWARYLGAGSDAPPKYSTRAGGQRSRDHRLVLGCRERPPDASPLRPASPRWRDVEGTPLPLLCRIEQIAVRPQQGAMPSRLRQHGQVLGWDTHRLHVCFKDERWLVLLQPHLVRVLTQAPGGD